MSIRNFCEDQLKLAKQIAISPRAPVVRHYESLLEWMNSARVDIEALNESRRLERNLEI